MLVRRTCACLLILLFLSVPLRAQDATRATGEEIDVSLTIQQLGSTVIPAVLVNDDVFLPMFDIFRFLRIKTLSSVSGDTLTGFFLDEKVPYIIDFSSGSVEIGGVRHVLAPADIIRSETAVFVRRSRFKDVFGFECYFNFRALLVDIRGDIDFPVIRELRRERLRKGLGRITGMRTADRRIRTGFTLFEPGVIDWSLSVLAPSNGRRSLTGDIAAGAGLLGGDADLRLTTTTSEQITTRSLMWQWRHVDNAFAPLRQAAAGRFATITPGGRPASLLGFTISNTPTTLRSAFGTYVIDGFTDPEWTVELSLNQVLVDVEKADARGYYRFEVPLVYGNTSMVLRFFGPWGEERSVERVVSIPHTFLPAGEVEYSILAGRVESDSASYLGNARVSLGLGRYMTAGGGMQYSSSVTGAFAAPTLTASVRPFEGLLLSTEYVHHISSSVLATWNLPGHTSLTGSWMRYSDRIGGYLPGTEQRRLGVSTPFDLAGVQGNTRVLLRQDIIAGMSTLGVEGTMSFAAGPIRGSLGVLGERLLDASRMMTGSIAFGVRLPWDVTLRPQCDVDLVHTSVTALRSSFERPIATTGWLTGSVGRNLQLQSWSAQVSLRYELPFMQTATSVVHDRGAGSVAESVRGSLVLDDAHGHVHADPKSQLRRGGITVEPFLDVNGNGVRDAGERRLYGLDVRTEGGRIVNDLADSLIRIVDLEPYRPYYIEISPVHFENVSWQTRDKSYDILVLPDCFVTLPVPVFVAAEVSGRVAAEPGVTRRDLSGFTVQFRDSVGRVLASVLTEKDGSYYYLGLAPGSYSVGIDAEQLAGLRLETKAVPLVISASEDGDIRENVNLTLQRIE